MEHISKAQIKFIRSLQQKKYRDESGMFVAEGSKCIEELSRSFELVLRVNSSNASATEIAQMSGLRTPQGEIAVFKKRAAEERHNAPQDNRLVLALDDIQDPGNLGTILRTADALNIPVVLLEGCADPYSHKTVRASMGAVFRSPVVRTTWENAYNTCRDAGIDVAVTALSDRAVDLRNAPISQMAVVIGSEGQGVRKEILEAAQAELIIPMNENCESLNAAIAASIVMWEMTQL